MDRDNNSFNARESRTTSSAGGKSRRSKLAASKTASPFHNNSHNAFIRYCETHTLTTFSTIFAFLALIAIIGCAVTFSYRDDVLIGKQSSSLILSSGEGMIARINAYVIDLPDAECKGIVSTFPHDRYSATLLDIVSEDSGDDFYRPEDCKWLSQLSIEITVQNATFPSNLVGACNAYPVATGYTEAISIVFKGNDLLTASALRGMCDVDRMIRSYDRYTHSKCRLSHVDETPCCPSRSVSNYAAALFNLESCEDITDATADQLSALLDTCRDSYLAGTLTGDCWDWARDEVKSTQCPLASVECARYNAVYDILNSLTTSVISEANSSDKLTVARLMVPFNSTNNDWLEDLYYEKLQFKTNENYGGAKIMAYDLRVKSEVFGNFLSWDALFLIPITIICVCSILAHDHSLCAAVFVVLGIYLSFGLTMFVIGVILWISYIPFFTFFVLSVMLYVGLGFFFLLSSSWKDSFESLGPVVNNADRMAYVWHHTSLKTFASALCSSVCFFTAILFPLPSIKVFGMFCGIIMLILFLVTNFFFPVIIIMDHKNLGSDHFFWGRMRWIACISKFDWDRMFCYFEYLHNWKKTILVLMTAAVIVIGSYSFIMQMERVASAQLLFTSHPFERYDRTYDMKFRDEPLNRHGKYDMAVVFGVRDANTISTFNPNRRADMGFYQLNISGQEAQQDLYNLCVDMVNEKGNPEVYVSIQNMRCYPLFFTQWMQAPCASTMNAVYPDTSTWLTPERTDCCGHTETTYSDCVFAQCLPQWSQQYGDFDTGVYWDPSAASPHLMAVSVGMSSNEDFNTGYDKSWSYWDDMNEWVNGKLKGSAVHKGFFTANMELLRYQRGLIVGLKVVVPLAVTVAALVVLFMTRNVIAAASFLFTVLFVLWAISGSLQILGEKFSLFVAVVAVVGTGLAAQSASLVSLAFCEAGAGPGNVDMKQIGQEVLYELGPASVLTTAVLCLSAICMLGGNNYYTFAFGAAFILIVFYIILLPQFWNLLVLSQLWLKHPIGQLLSQTGLTPPPCCMVEARPSEVEVETTDIHAVNRQSTDDIHDMNTTISPVLEASTRAQEDSQDDEGSIVSSADL